jgi:predicted secreted hydrolase
MGSLMHPRRRRWLQALAAWSAAPTLGRAAEATRHGVVQEGRALAFPADHGAHLDARTEWWYATGWLGSEAAPTHGFQITFFRSRTGLAAHNPSRFAARQLLFAHAAVTEITTRRHAHDQRLQRWNGSLTDTTASASTTGGAVHLAGWSMHDDGSGWRVRTNLQATPAPADPAPLPGSTLALDLHLARSQPLLLQGRAGFSRKGPEAHHASHYYSEVQLQASGRVTVGDTTTAAGSRGRAWMDHEWSEAYLPAGAVGWDWIGINLFDGSALMAFVMRRADGSALWAGGSFRAPGAPARAFGAEEVRFMAGTRWRSPATGANYPVLWQVQSPAGQHTVRALVDAQELDSRSSTGTVYWEGLSELLDAQGRRIGLGYLEMTGYAAALKL